MYNNKIDYREAFLQSMDHFRRIKKDKKKKGESGSKRKTLVTILLIFVFFCSNAQRKIPDFSNAIEFKFEMIYDSTLIIECPYQNILFPSINGYSYCCKEIPTNVDCYYQKDKNSQLIRVSILEHNVSSFYEYPLGFKGIYWFVFVNNICTTTTRVINDSCNSAYMVSYENCTK